MDMGTLGSRGSVEAGAPASRIHDMKEAKPAQADAAVQAEELQVKSKSEPEREQVLAAVTDMQDYVDAAARNIQFQLDDDSGRMVVTVTEASTGDVIRQMPSEEALRLAENLAEMSSVLFRGEA